MTTTAEPVRAAARALGFTRIGIVPAEPSATLDAYRRWIAADMHAGMGYMARPDRVARREDLRVILPGARSLIVVALDYRQLVPADVLRDPGRGRFACYAWGADYHEVLLARLERLAQALEPLLGARRCYVDTGPLLERSHAQRGGLGFVGKNTMLIHPRAGSLFFLGEILTDAAFDDYDAPLPRASMCGSCARCLSACPTDAFPQPYVLDARRCISYWTIEHRGSIDAALRSRFGNWVFGCDICNEVCPFQRFAPLADEPAFAPESLERAAPPLTDLLALDEAGFAARYRGTAVWRLGRERLLRNACVAAGNWGSAEAVPALERLLQADSPLLAEHAAWALNAIEQAERAR